MAQGGGGRKGRDGSDGETPGVPAVAGKKKGRGRRKN